MKSLALVASHPVQYQAPWYRALATMTDLRVFFAHRIDADEQARAGFGVPFDWDIPLFDGYAFEWLENVSARPGIDRFRGCDTPQLAQRIQEGRFDAVVVNGWNLLSYWQAVRAAHRAGIPVMVRGDSQLVTSRGRLRRSAKRLVYPRLLKSFDAFLTVGRRNEDYYRHYGIGADRLFRSPHCVDNEFFARSADAARQRPDDVRGAAGISADAIVFAFVGKLIPKKRPLDFLMALEQTRRTRPEARGLIVGDGPLRKELEDYQRRHDTGCATIGFLNQREIARAYAAADALVLPSTGGETWGLVVNEAMACGTPAIVSDEAGCAPDLIDEGRTGFTYPCRDVAALADRMTRLAASGLDERRAMGSQAIQRIAAFSPHAAAAGVVDAMNVLAARHPRTQRTDPHHVDAVS
jgi:glycosyltransferase involved in cell wall biosynthesis